MKKKSKSGFTLVELLAVIAILAILVILAIPKILDIYEQGRKNVFMNQAKSVFKAAEQKYLKETIKTTNTKERDFIYCKNMWDDEGDIKLVGKQKDLGYLARIDDDGFYKYLITDGKYYVKGANDGEKIKIEELDFYDGYFVVDCKLEKEGILEYPSGYVGYGGKYINVFNDVKETSDGGFIAVGYTNSPEISGIANKGGYDAFIVKTDSEGMIEWEKTFGGSYDDVFKSVVEFQNGYVVAGTTLSNDKEVSGLKVNSNVDDSDLLFVKYDYDGNVVNKKVHGNAGSNGSDGMGNIIVDGSTIIVFGHITAGVGAANKFPISYGARSTAVMIKLDANLNILNFNGFGGSYYEPQYNGIKTSDNHYVSVGATTSFDHDLTGLTPYAGYNGTNYSTLILKRNSAGTVVAKKVFYGTTGSTFLTGLIEVSDGYIIIGQSNSNNGTLAGLNYGGYDGIILKINKTLNSIIWIKHFGGTADDVFTSILKLGEDKFLVLANSRSVDKDMTEMNKSIDDFNDIVFIEYDANGNVLGKKAVGGSNMDYGTQIIKTTEGYIISGYSYSKDGDMDEYVQGIGDAVLIRIDENYNISKKLRKSVNVVDVPLDVVKDYGTSIATYTNKYQAIYTSDDPTKNITQVLSPRTCEDPKGNLANFVNIAPFNPGASRIVMRREQIAGQQTYLFEKILRNNSNWIEISLYYGNAGSVGISNFKLVFEDGYTGTVNQSLSSGYIEPLVIYGMSTTSCSYFFPNTQNILNGGDLGTTLFPSVLLYIKPKKSSLKGISLNATRGVGFNGGGLYIYELLNYDMSLTKAE